MSIRAGSKVDATDFDTPDVVSAFGNGTNVITATAFAVLPTTTCTAVITNPHATANMLTLVSFGAWMIASANAVRICPAVTGATTIAAGIGAGGPLGWGEIPLSSTTTLAQYSSTVTYSLPPGTSTFSMQAFRDSAAGTQNVNYATIRLIPLYFLF